MDLKLEHIGYITDNIDATAAAFRQLGYEQSETVCDDTQKTRIAFLTKAGDTKIELVEPYEDNKTMQKMLRRGIGPYHTCYTVGDIDAAYSRPARHEDEFMPRIYEGMYGPEIFIGYSLVRRKKGPVQIGKEDLCITVHIHLYPLSWKHLSFSYIS